MNKSFLFLLSLFILLLAAFFYSKPKTREPKIIAPTIHERTWEIKSIDTMKYSRDLALSKLNDKSFEIVIDSQVKAIKNTGANYVAVATPYDEKFYPVLSRWVSAARRNNLHVYFKGNFAGWEGWFHEKRNLSQSQHIQLTKNFIQSHPDLFRNGDIFSPCPECENGGPGDPRYNTNVQDYRKFIISEHQAADEEFKKIGKNVATNFFAMNYDVATLVMDHDTTGAMGNLVVIDHYVETPEKLSDDIDKLSQKTGAKIFLGEIGAPIPDITGSLSSQAQANWLDESLRLIAKKETVIGINYWVSHGGSTSVFNTDNSPKPAGDILKKYFSLTRLD